MYLADKGITDRATVIIDAGGTVRYAASVGPGGRRDVEALVAECETLDADWQESLHEPSPCEALPEGCVLFIRDNCMFSRWALYTRANLHLEDALPVRNVSKDPDARAELERRGGKSQAPALAIGDEVMYESTQIAEYLAEHGGYK